MNSLFLFANNFYHNDIEQYMLTTEALSFGELRLLEVTSDVFLPVFKIVKLVITAVDVLHSWTLPSFGIKMDAIPGRINVAYLCSNFFGIYFGQCSELCGVNHGFMPIKIFFI